MRIRRFLHVVLFFFACLLVWQIVETWRRPLAEQRSAAQSSPLEEKPLPAFQAPPPQTGRRYAEVIADKDLFAPSRSRAAVETKPVATVPPPSHLKLVGVVLTHGREEALFADSTQGGKVVRIRRGEALGSYKLVGVAPLQATLTMGQDGDEVSLPLLVLDSNTAAQGQRLLPPQMRGNQGRAVQQQARQVQPAPGPSGVTATPQAQPQNETHAIRQNIQQLQQRLRQLRKQAARNGSDEDEDDEDDEGDEEEEEE